jgi:hypothetical protein
MLMGRYTKIIHLRMIRGLYSMRKQFISAQL